MRSEKRTSLVRHRELLKGRPSCRRSLWTKRAILAGVSSLLFFFLFFRLNKWLAVILGFVGLGITTFCLSKRAFVASEIIANRERRTLFYLWRNGFHLYEIPHVKLFSAQHGLHKHRSFNLRSLALFFLCNIGLITFSLGWRLSLFFIYLGSVMIALATWIVHYMRTGQIWPLRSSFSGRTPAAFRKEDSLQSISINEIPVPVYYAYKNYQTCKKFIIMCVAGAIFIVNGLFALGLTKVLLEGDGFLSALSMLPLGLLASATLVGPFLIFFSMLLLFSRWRLQRWESNYSEIWKSE